MMNSSQDRRDSRFFTGDERELNELKKKESLQRFAKRARSRKRAARLAYTILFAVIVTVFAVICANVFFRVESVEVVGSARYGADEILSYTDIAEGVSLFSVSDRDLAGIAERLSYIREIRITRKLPNTLVLSVIEDKPRYFAELYGEYFILSDELRVLDRVFGRTALEGMGLIELVLPEVDSVLVGGRTMFSADVSQKYVTAYLDALESSPLYDRVTAFDLRDRFNLAMIASGIYLIDLGNGDELGTKLTAVTGMLEHSVLSDGVPATIDATDPSQCPVIKDPNLVVEFDD